jgi:hypothetical protein
MMELRLFKVGTCRQALQRRHIRPDQTETFETSTLNSGNFFGQLIGPVMAPIQ